jgi:hypothetical protein
MLEVAAERTRCALTAIEESQHGAMTIRTGKLLLWTVFVPAWLVYAELPAGLYMFFCGSWGKQCWALLLIEMGKQEKTDAHRQFVELQRGSAIRVLLFQECLAHLCRLWIGGVGIKRRAYPNQ